MASTAGIIVIGDEVLKGQVQDSNSYHLCRRLHAVGVKVCKVVVLSDDVKEIADEVARFSSSYNIVFTSGGVGPTHDDVTYAGVAKSFNEQLIFNRELADKIVNFYPGDNRDVKSNPALKMALVPKSSKLIYLRSKGKSQLNDVSHLYVNSVPIVRVSNVYIFPGLPEYFHYIVDNLDILSLPVNDCTFHTQKIYLNEDEVAIIPVLNKAVEQFKDSVTFGSYPVLNDLYCTKITMESMSQEDVFNANAFLQLHIPPDMIVKWDENPQHRAAKDVYNAVVIPEDQFSHRVKQAVEVVEECLLKYKDTEIFLSFNGGKDCTALLHLVFAVFQKKYSDKSKLINTLYIKYDDTFPEVEDFITQSVKRYKLNLVVLPAPIKNALENLLVQFPNTKAVLMGTRRTDPYSKGMNHFQMTDENWPQVMRVSPLLDWSYQDIWTFLKELFVPYCTLYDIGFGGQVLQDVHQFEKMLTSSFGPIGKAVLTQQVSGKFTITKSGVDILSACFPDIHHIPQVFLLKHIKTIQEKLGDGVKSFIIMLATLYSCCKTINRPIILSKQLNLLNVKLSGLFTSQQETFLPLDSDVNITIIRQILESFFICRFPESIATILSSLLIKWMNHLAVCKYSFHKLLKYFSLLCICPKLSQPLKDSYVNDGFSMFGTSTNLLKWGSYIVKILVFNSDDSDCDGICCDETDLENEVENFLCEIKCNQQEILEDVIGIVLITSHILPEMSVFHLKRQKVTVIQGIPHEEVTFIRDSIMKLQQCPDNVIMNLKSEIHKTSGNIWIDLPTSQLVLRAPSFEIGLQYVSACRNAIMVLHLYLSHEFTNENLTCLPVCKAGGVFETNLYAFLLQKFNLNMVAYSRNELLKLRDTEQTLQKWAVISNLVTDNKTNPVLSNTSSVLCSDVSHVSNVIYYSIGETFQVLDKELISAVGQAVLSIPRNIEMFGHVDIEGFDCVVLRIEILRYVLEVCATLLHVDGEVCLKNC